MSANRIQRALQLGPNERRWRDLRGWRLSLGLALGSVTCTVLIFIIEMFDAGVSGDDIIAMMLGMLILGGGWQLLGGWAYLLLVPRQRGKTGLAECLLLGVGLMVTLPGFISLVILGLAGRAGVAEAFSGFSGPWILLSLSVFTVFGLVCGWMLWRVGVKPAQAPVAASAAVFE
jgi:hypothetical protein